MDTLPTRHWRSDIRIGNRTQLQSKLANSFLAHTKLCDRNLFQVSLTCYVSTRMDANINTGTIVYNSYNTSTYC